MKQANIPASFLFFFPTFAQTFALHSKNKIFPFVDDVSAKDEHDLNKFEKSNVVNRGDEGEYGKKQKIGTNDYKD